MNFIDITQNKNTHCIKNHSVVVTDREGIQGPPGRDGATPYIDSETYHWLINGVDTGISAKGRDGADGKTPSIGSNGNWFFGDEDSGIAVTSIPQVNPVTGNWMVNGTDTGIKAVAKDGADGSDGETPHIGVNGNWFLGLVDTNVKAVADTIAINPVTGNWVINNQETEFPSKGRDGYVPLINPLTGTWMIGTEDTNVKATADIVTIGTDGYWEINGKNTGVKASVDSPSIGENGNWFIGNNDTNVIARGKNGSTPTINKDGFWCIDDVNTGVLAQAQTPYIGDNGNWFVYDDNEKKYIDSDVHASSQIVVYRSYDRLPGNSKNPNKKPNEYDLYIVEEENYALYKYNNQDWYKIYSFENLTNNDISNILSAITGNSKKKFSSIYQALLNFDDPVNYDNIFDALMGKKVTNDAGEKIVYTNILQALVGDATLESKYDTIMSALDQMDYFKNVIKDMNDNPEFMWNEVVICCGASDEPLKYKDVPSDGNCSCDSTCKCHS